ncbi:Hypothetical protein MELLADRAFT_72355 [Melampsora larici-populina 98AG31]|uniref:DUF1749-domain-containing protein n=1 Tax=Melampsora larici-populina (strain 98AG31 / pathotype 3-4-7) TaxID=747676 RepID=F4RSV7_MELLP|nr:Hypothetical protein MELLADRAFT_72355 [Melampsora larici-populina 98AG31]EGG04538.1 Hypothetical protein MELLADRAFT_72355 [Melampsora larici-populina 98AG31]
MTDQLQPPTLGLLHLYNSHDRLTAFESGDLESPNTLIFIGGLGDGFCSVPYLNQLSNSLHSIGWSLIQILLTSSYTGFGTTDLNQDVKEIQDCLKYLIRLGKNEFVLMGHSTGCQDIVRLVNDQPDVLKNVIGTILQAPVSDREYILDVLGEENYQRSIKIAKELIEAGKPNQPIPLEFCEMFSGGKSTISAHRWISLSSKLQDNPSGEDFFSSDLTIEDLSINLKAFNSIKTMILFSGRDESVPKEVNKNELLERLVVSCGGKVTREWSVLFEGAGHLAEEVVDEISDRVIRFIQAIS